MDTKATMAATARFLAKMREQRDSSADSPLEQALRALVDHEGKIKAAMADRGLSDHSFHDVCDALRHILDEQGD